VIQKMPPRTGFPSDEEIVRRVRAGDSDLFEVLMRRYDQRVYRVVRSVLRNDSESEEVTQKAWVRAFTHLDQFRGRARFSTWLTRIAIHEAWADARRQRRFEALETRSDRQGEQRSALTINLDDPERQASRREAASLLETAIEALPSPYRVVFVLRELEELSTAETAACLELTADTVKTRLHRARAMLKRDLARFEFARTSIYRFLGARCDRMVKAVFDRLRRRD
jgi:RNA polymerase sigma-70 factor (ECF subfamily)